MVTRPVLPEDYSLERGRYDRRILEFVAYFDAVTTHQLLYRFFGSQGKSPVYGYRLLNKLEGLGLLYKDRVWKDQGMRSLQYVRLTRPGWLILEKEPPKGVSRPLPQPVLELRLQRAEMTLVRAEEGWREVRPEGAFKVLRKVSLARYGNRHLNDHEVVERSTLEAMPASDLPFSVLFHPERGEARVVLEMREGMEANSLLPSLDNPTLFSPIDVELVAPRGDLAMEARRALERFSDRHDVVVRVHSVRHFADRPNPRH